jgi:predicted molibdopterin-dependent oxidoreductase YjgC
MMGVCFECLIEIDGTAERQACMVTVVDGMSIRRSTRPAGLGT